MNCGLLLGLGGFKILGGKARDMGTAEASMKGSGQCLAGGPRGQSPRKLLHFEVFALKLDHIMETR